MFSSHKKKKISIESHEQKVRKSLRYSIWDGTFYSLMVGFGESFFGAYAVFLKATTFELGLISSLPQAMGALAQLFSMRLIRFFKSRKIPVLINSFLEGIMFIPLILAYFLGEMRVTYLLLFLCLYWMFRMIINPAWSSWMGDLVPTHERGRYFGKRNRYTGLGSLLALVIGGYILFVHKGGAQYTGFVLVFLIAMMARMASTLFLSKKYDPGYTQVPGSSFGLIEFLRKMRFNNYGLFVIFLCLMNFAVYISSPFFTAYLLRDLHVDYLTFTIITAAPLLVKFLSTGLWGALSDRYGSRKVLALCAFLIPFVPLMFLFSTDIYFIVAIQVISGFVWAGFDIATFNFILDCTSTLKRATAVSYYNLLNGIAMLGGAVVGGLIVSIPATFFWSKYYLVFVVSFVVRLAVSALLIPKIHEMRQVEKASYAELVATMVHMAPSVTLQHKTYHAHDAAQKPICKTYPRP